MAVEQHTLDHSRHLAMLALPASSDTSVQNVSKDTNPLLAFNAASAYDEMASGYRSLRKPSTSSTSRQKTRREVHPYARTTLPSTSLSLQRKSSATSSSSTILPQPEDTASGGPKYLRGRPRNKWIPQSLLYFSNSSALTSTQPFYLAAKAETLINDGQVTLPAQPCTPSIFQPEGLVTTLGPVVQPGGSVTPIPTSFTRSRGEPEVSGDRARRYSIEDKLLEPGGINTHGTGGSLLPPTGTTLGYEALASPLSSSSISQRVGSAVVWYEERNSAAVRARYPYHSDSWEDVLPGPAQRLTGEAKA